MEISMIRDKMHLQEVDLRMIDIYKNFLPEQIFDAHMHLYLAEAAPHSCEAEDNVFLRKVCSIEDYWTDMGALLPGVKNLRMNMIVMPDPILNDLRNGLREKANNHILEQHKIHPECVATPYILPCDNEETIYALTNRPGYVD